MEHKGETLVMKFGGASMASPAHFARLADLILLRAQLFGRIVIVVSAMGETTNQLIELAQKVNPDPPRREYDMLVTAGERISISLLAMALAAKRQEAVSFTGSQSGIITCNRHSDARIIDVKPHRLLRVLEKGKIAIVAGFQGVSGEGEITTLGRGGSDTTAVALGVALGAVKVEFFKDVPGIFSDDPKINSRAEFFPALTYDQAITIARQGAKILHHRCLEMARRNYLPLHIRSFSDDDISSPGTWIEDPKKTKSALPLYETIS